MEDDRQYNGGEKNIQSSGESEGSLYIHEDLGKDTGRLKKPRPITDDELESIVVPGFESILDLIAKVKSVWNHDTFQEHEKKECLQKLIIKYKAIYRKMVFVFLRRILWTCRNGIQRLIIMGIIVALFALSSMNFKIVILVVMGLVVWMMSSRGIFMAVIVEDIEKEIKRRRKLLRRAEILKSAAKNK